MGDPRRVPMRFIIACGSGGYPLGNPRRLRDVVNNFVGNNWEGVREAALVVCSGARRRADVPEDVLRLALELLEESAARKNRSPGSLWGFPHRLP